MFFLRSLSIQTSIWALCQKINNCTGLQEQSYKLFSALRKNKRFNGSCRTGWAGLGPEFFCPSIYLRRKFSLSHYSRLSSQLNSHLFHPARLHTTTTYFSSKNTYFYNCYVFLKKHFRYEDTFEIVQFRVHRRSQPGFFEILNLIYHQLNLRCKHIHCWKYPLSCRSFRLIFLRNFPVGKICCLNRLK